MHRLLKLFRRIMLVFVTISLLVPSYKISAYSAPTYQDTTTYSVRNMTEADLAIRESLDQHASKMILKLDKGMDYYDTYDLIVPYTRGLGTYTTHNFGYVVNGGSWSELEINVRYYTTVDEEKKLEETIGGMIDKWNSGSTYSKVKAVHDYICENTVYSDYTAKDMAGYDYHSAYDALINKEAVCSGYALLFQKIMDHLGIPCYVYIDDKEVAHAWNIVYVDNAWYQVDCTWDDFEDGYTHDNFLKGEGLEGHNYSGDIELSKTDYQKRW